MRDDILLCLFCLKEETTQSCFSINFQRALIWSLKVYVEFQLVNTKLVVFVTLCHDHQSQETLEKLYVLVLLNLLLLVLVLLLVLLFTISITVVITITQYQYEYE